MSATSSCHTSIVAIPVTHGHPQGPRRRPGAVGGPPPDPRPTFEPSTTAPPRGTVASDQLTGPESGSVQPTGLGGWLWVSPRTRPQTRGFVEWTEYILCEVIYLWETPHVPGIQADPLRLPRRFPQVSPPGPCSTQANPEARSVGRDSGPGGLRSTRIAPSPHATTARPAPTQPRPAQKPRSPRSDARWATPPACRLPSTAAGRHSGSSPNTHACTML